MKKLAECDLFGASRVDGVDDQWGKQTVETSLEDAYCEPVKDCEIALK